MLKISKKFILGAFAFAAAVAGYSAPAAAQATRTWVSGTGDDVNPCSRTAPCKTFAGAISKTASGGVINCLDPGGYGPVNINKSLTIDCHFTGAGVFAGGNGITVNDSMTPTPNTAVVYLRGLDFHGVNPPSSGVRFIAGSALHLEDSLIRRFDLDNSFGVKFTPGAAAKLYISNTTIADNGTATTGGGIEINPAVNGTARVFLKNVRVRNNANDGIRTDSTNGAISLVLEDSDVTGNGRGVAVLGGSRTNVAMITNSVVANNGVVGIVTTGTAVARVDTTTITGNRVGISAEAPSQLLTYGGNRLDQNPPFNAAQNFNGTFTNTTPLTKQ